jgi:hypothetical protein
MAKEVDSLSVQKQLNALFDQRLNSETRILSTMQQELKVALQLQSVMNGLSAGELEEKLKAGAEAMKALGKEAEETGDVGAKAMKQIVASTEAAKKSTSGVGSVLTGIGSTMKTLVTTGAGVAKSAFNIGKAFLSIPMGIFKNLMADAAGAAGDTSFIQALEDIRKEFGSFKEGTSKDILGAYGTMNKQLQAVSGLSVWQVFDKPADQLKYLHEMASKAGSQILQFGDELSKSAGIIATFDKGMGIGAENMKSMMARATVFGTSLTTQLGDVANYALQLGKDFGISSKILSKEVGAMMKDVRNFGSLTQKEMTVAAVYTKKLGLEMKDLTGLVDKFDNFDKAAESSAQLSQAFGATVDAFKLMNEQDPAKRLDELRKSMAATGKSTENMTRQELHLLAQTSGLSDEAAKLAFSTKNQGLSYDQVNKQANKAELAQIKQADALSKLADNIERVVRSGGQMQGSFFKMFFAGMEQGVKWSNSYRTAMMNVRQALMSTFMAGRQVGKELGDNDAFGFSRFMKGFGTAFGPANVNKILHGFTREVDVNGKKVKQSFGGVVGELNSFIQGKQGIGDAISHIRTTFHEAVGPDTFKLMIDGGKDVMRSLAKGVGSGTAFLSKELLHVVKTLTDFIKNPKEFLDKARSAGAGGVSFGAEIIKTISDSFGDPTVLKDLRMALVELAKTLAIKFKEVMSNPEVQKVLLEVAGPLISGVIGKNMLTAAPGILSKFGPQLAKLLSTGLGGTLAAVGGVALAGIALVNVNKKLDEFEKGIDKRRDPASKKIGAYGASLLQGLTLGLIPDNIAIMLGDKIAELADAVFGAIKDKMGGPFTNKLKTYFSSYINFLSSIGGLIGAIFSGNSGAISKAAEDVGNNLVKLMSAGFDFLVTEFPKLLVKLSSVIFTVVGALMDGFGKAIVDIGAKIPLIGPGIQLVGFIMMGLGKAFKAVGNAIGWVSDKLKNFDLSTTVGNEFNKIKLMFVDLGTSILGNMPAPIAFMLGINDKMKEKMMSNLVDLGGAIRKSMVDAAAAEADVKAKADAAARVAAKAAEGSLGTPDAAVQAGASGPSKAAQQTQVDVQALMEQKKTLEDNLKELNNFANAGVIKNISDSIPKASTALTEFNDKLSKSSIDSTIGVTQGVVKSINDLNMVLGDGNAGAIKIGEKLQRFANNSGLGKNGTYEIKNKGIQLKLDLKVTMDAGEVEKAILMRKESIIFDMLDNGALTLENQRKVAEMAARKGGG